MRDWLIAIGLLCLLIGCKADLNQPPKVRWGEEPCAHCNMLISDQQFAAALTLQNGETRKYDDIGCLLKDSAAHKAQIHRIWVRRYDRDEWLDARQAWFVHSEQIHSPMGFNFAAVGSEEDARRLASSVKGKVLRFDELLETQAREVRPHSEH